MPELPEAETIVRGLRPTLRGARIVRSEILHADVLRQEPERFRARVRSRTIRNVERRGKNVVLPLEDTSVILINLGMTGRLLPRRPADPSTSHPAVRFHLVEVPGPGSSGDEEPPGTTAGRGVLVYDDVRRFGAVEVLDAAEWRERSAALGPEPLAPDYDAERLGRDLGTSRSPVRTWLLDQRKVAGVGNIYANEALHRARVHPRRPARSLSPAEVEALHRALQRVLQEAIRARGTTLRDYRDASGEAGGFAPDLLAYGREGEPCGRCGTAIRRLVFGGRPAFLCSRCQPEET